MIKIQDKHLCCGCASCVQVCPKQCIDFDEDKQGFRYPIVNEDFCVNCGLCEKVCPVLNQSHSRKPLVVYAAQNPNEEVRLKSSSGGIFTLLSEYVIDKGGVVFGAKFDSNWEVEHGYCETKEGLDLFRGSKYIQSRIGKTYEQASSFLKAGRKVLYSGTSCQIAGLKRFLRKDYDNLLAVDVVCHGVPSPLVWRSYLETVKHAPYNNIKYVGESSPLDLSIHNINFRDKRTGWKKYSIAFYGKSNQGDISKTISNNEKDTDLDVLFHEKYDQNLFMRLFLKNLCLRPSCSSCPSKGGKCGSDITLADFWGISNYFPNWDDDKGTSLVLINSTKGKVFFEELDVNSHKTVYEMAVAGNPSIEQSVVETGFEAKFWDMFEKSELVSSDFLLNQMDPSRFQRYLSNIKKRLLHSFLFR